MIDTILTLEEAASLLGVHQRTVKRLLLAGEIDGCRFPTKRRVYFLKSNVLRLQEQGTRKRGRPRKEDEHGTENVHSAP